MERVIRRQQVTRDDLTRSPKAPDPIRVLAGRKPVWSRPFWFVEWIFEGLSYGLSHWAFLEVLEYLGGFGVLIAVIF